MRTVRFRGHLGGMYAQEGCKLPAHYMLGYNPPHPPWTEFLTHACENITFK